MAHLSTLIAGACLLFLCPTYASGQDGQDATTEATTVSGSQQQTSTSESIFTGGSIGPQSGRALFGSLFESILGALRPWLPIVRSRPVIAGNSLPGWPTGEVTGSTGTLETAAASGSRAGAAPHAVSRRRGGSAKGAHSRKAGARGRGNTARALRG